MNEDTVSSVSFINRIVLSSLKCDLAIEEGKKHFLVGVLRVNITNLFGLKNRPLQWVYSHYIEDNDKTLWRHDISTKPFIFITLIIFQESYATYN